MKENICETRSRTISLLILGSKACRPSVSLVMPFMIDGLHVSGILKFRIIADAEDATDISDSIALPGDKSGGLLGNKNGGELPGDKSGGLLGGRLFSSIGCTEVVGVEAAFPFTYNINCYIVCQNFIHSTIGSPKIYDVSIQRACIETDCLALREATVDFNSKLSFSLQVGVIELT